MDAQTKYELIRLAGLLVIFAGLWYIFRKPNPPKSKHPKFKMKWDR